ncbi:MAG: antitoxin YezG family protein [Pelosinus sp.]|nr:antitoxin YezG family protein [Pelosinus sp.]
MDTKGMEKLYPKIAKVLVDIIPEDWDKVYLYAEIREGYRQVFFYYYPEKSNSPIYSLDITDKFNINEKQFDERETQLYNCFSELRKEFEIQKQELWTNLTFILDSTGKMKLDYGYEDLSQISPVEKQDKWEAKYLSM